MPISKECKICEQQNHIRYHTGRYIVIIHLNKNHLCLGNSKDIKRLNGLSTRLIKESEYLY